MKKYLLLAALLSVGILSVTQPANAFDPGGYPWPVKAGVKVEAKVTIYKNKDGKPAGFKLEALDPVLAEAILENAFDFMDKDGTVYTSEDGAPPTEDGPPETPLPDDVVNPPIPDETPPSDPGPEDEEPETEPAYKDGGPVGPDGDNNPQ